MMRTYSLAPCLWAVFACLAVLSFPAASSAQTPESAMRRLLAWEGRYPLDGKPDFFADPVTGPLVRQTVPADTLRLIRRLYVNSPFGRSGDILSASLCKPHDCPSLFAMLYLDTARGTLQVCLSEYDPARGENVDTWIGNTVRPVPAGTCHGGMAAFEAHGDAGGGRP
jgi:hypothetical protein